MNLIPVSIIAIILALITGCATPTYNPEAIGAWEIRAHLAWESMSDGSPDKLDTRQLKRAFAQNGMSTPDSVTFVVYPKVGGSISADNITISVRTAGTESLPVEQFELHSIHVGSALRVTVKKLDPDTLYNLDIKLPETQSFELSTRTAPLSINSSSASIVLLSCNEPWSRAGEDLVDDKMEHPRVALSTANALRLLDLRANGKLPVVIDGKESARPSFLLGLGDQAYVDAEAARKGSLAIFGGKRSDELRIDISEPEDWTSVLDTVYRMHFLVPTLDRALKALPNAMVWDDHEIRDGWGSQGDEGKVIPGTDNLMWSDYYTKARKKASEFEVARNLLAGGLSVDGFLDDKDREMDTTLDWGPRIKVFMMDTRSERKTSLKSIRNDTSAEQPLASREQFDRLKSWLGEGAACSEQPSVFIVGTPVPLSLDREQSLPGRLSDFLAGLIDYRHETSDDVIDGWGWRGHTESRKELLESLKNHSRKCNNDRIVIVSGDVHESGLYALTDKDNGNAVYAYEIISSGIGTLIGKQGIINKAQISTSGTTTVEGFSQVGRIAGGASFAELFVDLDLNNPPSLKVLFYSTTGADDKQALKNTLVNAAPWVERQRVWSTGSTRVKNLFEGNRIKFVTTGNLALQLDYGIQPPPLPHSLGTNYGLTSAAIRCEVPGSNALNSYAIDWSTLMDKDELGKCW